MSYLVNAWYMAGWAHEFSMRPLARRICDLPMVLFRDMPSTVAALHDRCPHRFAPLSYGDVHDGNLQCRYHGLQFNREGVCVFNPHGPINPGARIRSFPAIERNGAVWVWMGTGTPDQEAVPDLPFIERTPATATSMDSLDVRANYLIVVDNILDLSHVDYLHPNTLGKGGPNGAGTFTGVEPEIVKEGDDRLTLRWSVDGAVPRPLEQKTMSLPPDDRVRRSTTLVWMAPSVMTLSTVVESQSGIAAQQFDNTHILTPETSSTSHYFFSSTRDFAVDDSALNEEIAATRRRIFQEEDEWICHGIQDRLEGSDFWSLRPSLLRTDAASVQMRRMLDRLIAAENDMMSKGASA
jgi:phenylpropionate dioxygenase-like ring-hydroxylating dioxygenase large terminal subunit